jgi:hypothetical protein
MDESVIQREVKQAVIAAQIHKPASCHTLRHSLSRTRSAPTDGDFAGLSRTRSAPTDGDFAGLSRTRSAPTDGDFAGLSRTRSAPTGGIVA